MADITQTIQRVTDAAVRAINDASAAAQRAAQQHQQQGAQSNDDGGTPSFMWRLRAYSAAGRMVTEAHTYDRTEIAPLAEAMEARGQRVHVTYWTQQGFVRQ